MMTTKILSIKLYIRRYARYRHPETDTPKRTTRHRHPDTDARENKHHRCYFR